MRAPAPYSGLVRARVVIGWVLLGVAGVALAVGVTMTATSLTSQRIGLADEPITAGQELVPTGTTPARTTTVARTVTVTTAAPAPAAAPAPTATRESEPGDDHGGDRGGDDD